MFEFVNEVDCWLLWKEIFPGIFFQITKVGKEDDFLRIDRFRIEEREDLRSVERASSQSNLQRCNPVGICNMESLQSNWLTHERNIRLYGFWIFWKYSKTISALQYFSFSYCLKQLLSNLFLFSPNCICIFQMNICRSRDHSCNRLGNLHFFIQFFFFFVSPPITQHLLSGEMLQRWCLLSRVDLR